MIDRYIIGTRGDGDFLTEKSKMEVLSGMSGPEQASFCVGSWLLAWEREQ